jgi:predicted nucleic acid-binding protein
VIVLLVVPSFVVRCCLGSPDCPKVVGDHQFLAVLHCEAIPERAGDFYAVVKAARQQRGLTLDENDLWVAATALALGATLVSRDSDFGGIVGFPVVSLG